MKAQCLLRQWRLLVVYSRNEFTVSNTLKPRTKAPIVRGRTTPTDDDERAYGGPTGGPHVQTEDIACNLNIFHTK